jgi:hypothetical protein
MRRSHKEHEMNNCELLVLDYEQYLVQKIKGLDELIKKGYSTLSTRKEYRIYSQCLGEFRKIAVPYVEENV